MSAFLEKLRDRWLTWRTGKNKVVRDWEEWRDKTINYRGNTVQDYYVNFKHVIEVDPKKFWNYAEPFGWTPVTSFKQYEYPQKQLGDNAVGNWFRGDMNQWDGRFHLNDCFGGDYVFVATNNDEDAIMIALKFS